MITFDSAKAADLVRFVFLLFLLHYSRHGYVRNGYGLSWLGGRSRPCFRSKMSGDTSSKAKRALSRVWGRVFRPQTYGARSSLVSAVEACRGKVAVSSKGVEGRRKSLFSLDIFCFWLFDPPGDLFVQSQQVTEVA